jgi:hypothetical protein
MLKSRVKKPSWYVWKININLCKFLTMNTRVLCMQCVLLCRTVCGPVMVRVWGVCYDCQLEEGVSVVDLLFSNQYSSLV